MLIVTCILILKHRGGKYRGLSAILVVMILLLLIFLIKKIYKFIDYRDNIKQTEEWLNINDFPSVLEMYKTGRLELYPETTVLSDIDGEILSINVTTGDIVDDYDILMQIRNINGNQSDYDDVGEMIETIYKNYDEVEKEYNEFEMENGDKIKTLEKQLYNDQNALLKAMELNDIEGRKILENEIKDINDEYKVLKEKKQYLENKLNSLDNEAKLILNESNKYYYELEKQTPRAPYKGVIGNIYVNEGEFIKNGDKLITIINNNYTPEISVGLDFNEYLLTQKLKYVTIILENENWGDFQYKGKIYTRSPILNDEGKYTITIKIMDDVSDLILGDDNSKITVVFYINSTSLWVPDRCFKNILNNTGVLTLRDGDIIVDKEVGIKSIWNGWINVDELKLFGLENEEKIDGIQLCIRDWNNVLYEDETVVEWRNQFETIEDFCDEYIKINPMYWSGHRNAAIVSLLGGPGELIEVLCEIE